MECLHTLLLGAYKYLFHDLMSQITPIQKSEITASIDAFPLSGMGLKLSKNAPRYVIKCYTYALTLYTSVQCTLTNLNSLGQALVQASNLISK